VHALDDFREGLALLEIEVTVIGGGSGTGAAVEAADKRESGSLTRQLAPTSSCEVMRRAISSSSPK